MNKRILEALTSAGAFDCLEPNRNRLFQGLDAVMAAAAHRLEQQQSGQNELFGGGGEPEPVRLPSVPNWLPEEKLQREHTAIGFYLSAHPLDAYEALLGRLRVQTWAQFSASVKRGASAGRLAGTIVAKQERKTRTRQQDGNHRRFRSHRPV